MPDSSKSILIVDDEPQILRLFSSMLSIKYNVNTALDVDTAKSILEKEKYDLVITDIVMPGVSGLELVKFVKDFYPDTHLIVMSGIPDSLTKLHEMGTLPFIAKPFRFNEVMDRIAEELNS